eukprot:7131951-Pyramimonas_sp.AAC.1
MPPSWHLLPADAENPSVLGASLEALLQCPLPRLHRRPLAAELRVDVLDIVIQSDAGLSGASPRPLGRRRAR